MKQLERYKKLKIKKQRWFTLFQTIGEYVHLNKQDFETTHDNGDFLTEHIFDSTGPKSMRQASNGILSMVWKNAKESMRIAPHPDLPETSAVKKYFEDMNITVAEAMDDVKAGLAIALEEYMLDQVAFGTSGIGSFEGTESDLLFKAAGIQEIFIDQGVNGFVNTVYLMKKYTVAELIEEFGMDALSQGCKEAARANMFDKTVEVLHAIEPRTNLDPDKRDNKNMPILSMHIEIGNNHVIKESGYMEMPYYVSRFYKKKGEDYGRSMAMDALPDILEINNLKEARSVGIEKKLDPPLGVMNDAVAGNGVVDTSARGINVMNPKGRVSGPDSIFPLFSVGDIREADKGIEDLVRSIKEHFMLDRFLDTQNDVSMTLGEFTERAKRTAEAMQSIFTRIIREAINPTVERSVSILWRNKKLGQWNEQNGGIVSDEIPGEVLEFIATGQEFYEIQYMTPAARLMMANEAQGILRTWEFAGQLAGAKPEVLDNLDADESLKIIGKIAGANTKIFKDSQEVEQIRQARVQQQQEQAAMMAAQTAQGQEEGN